MSLLNYYLLNYVNKIMKSMLISTINRIKNMRIFLTAIITEVAEEDEIKVHNPLVVSWKIYRIQNYVVSQTI